MHASILPLQVICFFKYTSKIFKLIDKFQRCAVSYAKVGIAEVFLLKQAMTFVLPVLGFSPLKRV